MNLEVGSNGVHHSVSLETGHVTHTCHVIKLATRQPSIPHSLITRGQSKVAVVNQPDDDTLHARSSSPTSPLTPLPSTSATSRPRTPPRAAAPISDSDSSPELPTRPRAAMSTSGAAALDLPPTKLPLLHEGETTQSQLRQLEVHCANYFSLKEVAADKQVANVIGCFRDYRITTWLENDAERAAAILLTFKAFMVEVRERLLPTDWERTIKQEMLARKQAKAETFLSFMTAVERSTSLLINTPSHLDTAHICTLLESNMLTDLADDLNDEGKAADETNYKKWVDIVKRKDNTRIRTLNRLNEIADERAKRERRTTATVDERPPKRNKTNENAPPSTSGGPSSSTSNAAGGKRCPKLTEEERALLAANYGCTRCRLPFVGHGDAQEKTCPWPASTNYKPVSQATVDAAAAALTPDLRAKYGIKPKPAPIAAVAAVGLSEVEDSDDSVDSEASGY
ncbi:hypothetical protein C8R44DRAFT_746300 [Mycena epipterygia]|nr:hypothetical protein C8R44DRAFT_746300 [Mycena epipterygia]